LQVHGKCGFGTSREAQGGNDQKGTGGKHINTEVARKGAESTERFQKSRPGEVFKRGKRGGTDQLV